MKRFNGSKVATPTRFSAFSSRLTCINKAGDALLIPLSPCQEKFPSLLTTSQLLKGTWAISTRKRQNDSLVHYMCVFFQDYRIKGRLTYVNEPLQFSAVIDRTLREFNSKILTSPVLNSSLHPYEKRSLIYIYLPNQCAVKDTAAGELGHW